MAAPGGPDEAGGAGATLAGGRALFSSRHGHLTVAVAGSVGSVPLLAARRMMSCAGPVYLVDTLLRPPAPALRALKNAPDWRPGERPGENTHRVASPTGEVRGDSPLASMGLPCPVCKRIS